MNADPQVMEHFPSTLDERETAALIDRIEAGFRERGYGLWAVEVIGEAPFAGFIGLQPVPDGFPFAGAIEVGWRLARPFWGRGLAAEGAGAAIDFAFDSLDVPELVAYTAARNARSRRLMERLGMARDPAEDFPHPGIAAGDPLCPHVLYRLPRAAWANARTRALSTRRGRPRAS
jgi:RimJ/RimL family protein N-acetyltransferase